MVIDSITGYRKFLRGDDLLTDMHTLCHYLQNMGVAVFLTNEVQQIAGGFQASEHEISYVAGNILYLPPKTARNGPLTTVPPRSTMPKAKSPGSCWCSET